jgi:hypothetical protein
MSATNFTALHAAALQEDVATTNKNRSHRRGINPCQLWV